MLTIRRGNQIQSPNVDPNRTYVNRDIGNLARLGALGAGEDALLERVDGVIDNRPVDGKVDIDEMVRMEDANYQAALFPDEQRALPGLWRHMEWDAVAAAPPAPPQVRLQDQIQPRVAGPAALDYAQPFGINQLSAPLQRTARRIQLVLNGDNDPQTIAIPDVDAAIAAPGRFTAGDVREFGQIREELAALVRQAQPQLQAQVEVPAPGLARTLLPHAGRTEIRLVSDTQIQETRSLREQRGSSNFNNSLQASRNSSFEVDVPAGMQALLIDTGTGRETLFEAGNNPVDGLPEGTYRVELWDNGNRIESSEVNIPAVSRERADLGPYLGFEMLANGQPLVRNPTFARASAQYHAAGGTTFSARWSWDAQAQPAPADVDQSVLRRLQPPPIRLQPGTYQADAGRHGPVTVTIFGPNLARANVNGFDLTLAPSTAGRSQLYRAIDNQNARKLVSFDAASNQLSVADYVQGDRNYVQLKLSDDDRVA